MLQDVEVYFKLLNVLAGPGYKAYSSSSDARRDMGAAKNAEEENKRRSFIKKAQNSSYKKKTVARGIQMKCLEMSRSIKRSTFAPLGVKKGKERKII